MNIQEYIEAKRLIYSELAKCVAEILHSAISNAGQFDGVQRIQHREKEINSLSRKLKEQNRYHSDTIENEIKDLAGCRLIFYHNDDLNWFLNSSIISDNFDINWDQTKIHYQTLMLNVSWYTIAVCEAILTPVLEDTQWTHDKVTIRETNLSGCTNLAEIRSNALKLMQRFIANG